MSRRISRFLTSVTVSLMALANSFAWAADEPAELEQVRKTVGDMFEMIGPENVNPSPIPGDGAIVAYISGDGQYLLQGDIIDLNDQVNLTELARNQARKDLMDTLPDGDTILFSPEEVKYKVTVFTDVECTYCRRLHAQIDAYLAHGIQVRYLLYPRNGPASRSWNTSEEVWCANDRANALTMAKLDRDFPTATCDASEIQHHYAIGRDVGLSGTPAIILDDGTMIGGYLTPDQLKARLDQGAAR